MFRPTELAEDLKKQLHEIHSKKESPNARIEKELAEATDFFSLLLLAGKHYFSPFISLEDRLSSLLPFAYMLGIYQSNQPELQEFKARYNQSFDISVLNSDCKHLFQKLSQSLEASRIDFYQFVIQRMRNPIVTSISSSDARIRRNEISLLTLSFLPAERDIAFKIHQLAKADPLLQKSDKAKKFVQDTQYFREHVEDYATIYLSLTDEQQKEHFERFINAVYEIDNDLLSGKIPNLELFEPAFSLFEKITDPFYHHLTEKDISDLQRKQAIWRGLNFLALLAIIASIVTGVLHLWVFVPVLIISLPFVLHACLSKDEASSAFEKNEESQARVTFKKGYGEQLFALFSNVDEKRAGKEVERPAFVIN